MAALIARHPNFAFASVRDAMRQRRLDDTVWALEKISQDLRLPNVSDYLLLATSADSLDVDDQVERVVQLLIRIHTDLERAMDFAAEMEARQDTEFARQVASRLSELVEDSKAQQEKL